MKRERHWRGGEKIRLMDWRKERKSQNNETQRNTNQNKRESNGLGGKRNGLMGEGRAGKKANRKTNETQRKRVTDRERD